MHTMYCGNPQVVPLPAPTGTAWARVPHGSPVWYPYPYPRGFLPVPAAGLLDPWYTLGAHPRTWLDFVHRQLHCSAGPKFTAYRAHARKMLGTS